LSLAIALALINSSILVLNKKSWGYLFSEEEEVIKKVEEVLPLVALFQIADGEYGVGKFGMGELD
jgi:multidrug resistance protein, MATE family